MIIYLCTKFQSNTPILSNDIARKPFFKVENFLKLKRAITPKIIGGFHPKLNLAYTFYDYIPVYKISIQYTNPFKRYHTETKSVTNGTDRTNGRTYVRTAVILYAIENGVGIKKIWYFSYSCSKHSLWVLVRTTSRRRF